MFRSDLSAYILCLLNSIDRLASDIVVACARDSETTVHILDVEEKSRVEGNRDGPATGIGVDIDIARPARADGVGCILLVVHLVQL